jgi:peptidoglycan biosynthesis protein MviN/MurJ (putative lipid II flippase)
VPAGLGLAIGVFCAGILAPLLLVPGLAMSGIYGLLSRSA